MPGTVVVIEQTYEIVVNVKEQIEARKVTPSLSHLTRRLKSRVFFVFVLLKKASFLHFHCTTCVKWSKRA